MTEQAERASDVVGPGGARLERNWLLGALSAEEYLLVRPHLETVTIAAEQRLGGPNVDIPYVYFPQSGVVSVIRRMRSGEEVEVATVGAEGMSALAIFLGGHEMPTECIVQIAGIAHRIRAVDLVALSRVGGPLYDVLQRYAQYLFDQVAQSVACDRLHSLEQRAARWLLMTLDRVGHAEFLMTHEHLASLLGVRRAGVSTALDRLRRKGVIDYRRGRMEVFDREALEAGACECYFANRADFNRLLGRVGSAVGLPATPAAVLAAGRS